MSEVLALEHVALGEGGATLTMSIRAGQSIVVLGPAGSGKTRLLQTMAGSERPGQGRVHIRGRVHVASPDSLPRRGKVQSLTKAVDPDRATEALLATGLFEVRGHAVSELSFSRFAACEVLSALLSDAEVVMFDGQLDLLDPWTLGKVEALMRNLRLRGKTFVVASNRPDLASRSDALIVLREGHVRFAGTVEDLMRSGAIHTLHVETRDQVGVRALVEPFEVSIRKEGEAWRLEAREGQALAAHLLLEGYGDVRFVVVRPPTLEETLEKL